MLSIKRYLLFILKAFAFRKGTFVRHSVHSCKKIKKTAEEKKKKKEEKQQKKKRRKKKKNNRRKNKWNYTVLQRKKINAIISSCKSKKNVLFDETTKTVTHRK
jgi:hypothetical protein